MTSEWLIRSQRQTSKLPKSRLSVTIPASMVGIELGHRAVGGGFPISPFRLRDGFTIPPGPRFPRPPYHAGRPNFRGPVGSLGLPWVSLPIRNEAQALV